MQVLLYKCNDYTITIKTSDIVAAWNRFNSRVPESSRTYCTYASTHEADELKLLKVADDGKSTAMENVGGGKEWPPVNVFVHYMKNIYLYSIENGLMDKHCEELDAMDLPFNWRYIPVDYPQPEVYM